MQVNDALIDNLSNLACLEFSVDEKQEIKSDLERMISFVEKLNQLDTHGVEPLLQMSQDMNVFRQDLVEGSLQRQEVLANAPAADNQYFKVPKVIKNPSK